MILPPSIMYNFSALLIERLFIDAHARTPRFHELITRGLAKHIIQ